MSEKGRIGNKPIAVYESLDPAWKKFSVSIPGFSDTQWFNSRAEAEKFITDHGFTVFVKVPTVRITKAEHAALLAVAEAALAAKVVCSRTMDGKEVSRNYLSETEGALNRSLAAISSVREGKAVAS